MIVISFKANWQALISSPRIKHSLDDDIFIRHLSAHIRVLIDRTYRCVGCARVAGSQDNGEEVKGWKGKLCAGTRAGGCLMELRLGIKIK
jgi:hypothetical protein